jgi:hypothetical protein
MLGHLADLDLLSLLVHFDRLHLSLSDAFDCGLQPRPRVEVESDLPELSLAQSEIQLVIVEEVHEAIG